VTPERFCQRLGRSAWRASRHVYFKEEVTRPPAEAKPQKNI
jgi:hypothetical protein